ncbi:adenylate/guanylate cyclase domain-containing protein [Burkholderia diffusa]|uniref:ATP synthase subunit beta n=1 Tax=Burkholderia diffusa TaxID=488732 RepID=A0A6P2NCJ7_9BURK|nr:adenylate/guanylate cyclase domain-containing protein [Burkholderia diffusa]KAB0662650.1 AAA family ATPase [Burkholderia diffusa]MBM2654925.1 AAA family ATPase [Burkholderia diffusa]VWB92057.1 ATP synthase subunit beta [Burkholderia diffusa]
MRCTICGSENPPGARFCQECQAVLSRTCPQCGHEAAPAARFCSHCGTSLTPPAAAPSFSRPSGREPPPTPIHYTPDHLAERIRAEHAAMEARGEPAGERKTVTALFADMAGSTALIHDLDPEVAHRLIVPVVELMMEAVHYYEGYVAKSLGDGILALFGAPIAHEDHAQRALFAALRMQQAMRQHGDRIRLQEGIPLQIRVGVHTGEVVVRSIRTVDLHTEYDPLGHTIHIASRIEGIATPTSILVSESTHKLAEGYFEFKALGATQLKGIPAPLCVYEVLGLGALRTRLQLAAHRGLARFVGRETEMEHLNRALEAMRSGHGRVVGVVGEAGVGKSRLFHEFKERSRRGALVLETFSVSHGKAFPNLPLIELLKNYFQITTQDDERRCREKVIGKALALERSFEDLVPYVLYLLGIGEGGSVLVDMDPQIRRDRTFDAIRQLLVRESWNQPVHLLFEDLQWLDRETEAFLTYLVDHVPDARILLLVNYRPEYQPAWAGADHCSRIRLEPLGPSDAQGLLAVLLGEDRTLVPLKQLILEKTEGNPFFMEEVVQTLVEEQSLLGDAGRYHIVETPTTLHIPTTVQGVLAARIDRLPIEEKELLQALAVIGHEFPFSLIRQICGEAPARDDELRRLLAHLEEAEFIFERPAFPEVNYSFKHALTQEVAGRSLLTERRTTLHERTAQAIEMLFPTRIADYCSELAHHYGQSGNIPKAVEYLHRAAQQALRHAAHHDAMNHLGAALALLKGLPDTPMRAHWELTVLLSLGPVLMDVRGYGATEVGTTYTRALDLCERTGEASQRFATQLGLRMYHLVRGEYALATDLGKQMLVTARNANDPGLLVEAHSALGSCFFLQGDFGTARTHLEQALAIYDPEQHQAHVFAHGVDPGIRALSFLVLTLWIQGYPDQALKRSVEALALARHLSYGPSLAFSLTYTAHLHQLRREPMLAAERADAVIAVSTEHGLPYWLAWGTLLRGWAMSAQGDIQGGIAQMRLGLDAQRAAGGEDQRPYCLALLADSYWRAGDERAALDMLEEATTIVEHSGEHCYEAELYRLTGIYLAGAASKEGAAATRDDEAVDCFHRAIARARRQGARALELRAASDLARLLQRQGKIVEARQALSEVYAWFTEGFDTCDLREAKALLDALDGRAE